MDDEDKAALAAAVAEELRDAVHPGADLNLIAGIVVDRIEPQLRQMGWMPPETSGQVHDWGSRLGQIPEHHINRDVLNSHLCELWQIL